MKITDKQKEIFENNSNVKEKGECKFVSIMEKFKINKEFFYLIRYEGLFPIECGQTLAYMYSCFFDGIDNANVWCSEDAAKIDALCLYQKITGKSLPIK